MFGLTCSPFLLNSTTRHHLTKYIDLGEIKHVIERLILNLYVDDSTTLFNKLSDAIAFDRVPNSALGDANFNLRKWISNSSEFNKYFQSKNNEDMELAELNNYRNVLSLQWQLSTDKIVFKLIPIYEFAQLLKPTKRNVLKSAGMFYTIR